MNTFLIKTLGCKVNQYEGQKIKEELERAGMREAHPDETCALVVVNTCTVTSEADRKSRYEISRLHRRFPEARIVATGCYAEREAEELTRIPGVTRVVGQRKKEAFIDEVRDLLPVRHGIHPMQSENETLLSRFSGRGRAFIKIQDGCNMACSYCKVVLVRGKLRSRSTEAIAEETRQLVENGYREIVLSGIQLGAYGMDSGVHLRLVELMKRLLDTPGLERIRLSSINPYHVTDELIGLLEHEPRVCPHLHIPLQSGSNRVLEAMRRGYVREDYQERVDALRARVAEFSLTLDCMVGFPGETTEDFEATLDLLRRTRPLKVHAFPYSRRPGTWAGRLTGTVPGRDIRSRMKILIGLAESIRTAILEEQVGREVTFLAEDFDDFRERLSGVTPNYMPVSAPGSSGGVGAVHRRTITDVRSGLLLAA